MSQTTVGMKCWRQGCTKRAIKRGTRRCGEPQVRGDYEGNTYCEDHACPDCVPLRTVDEVIAWAKPRLGDPEGKRAAIFIEMWHGDLRLLVDEIESLRERIETREDR